MITRPLHRDRFASAYRLLGTVLLGLAALSSATFAAPITSNVTSMATGFFGKYQVDHDSTGYPQFASRSVFPFLSYPVTDVECITGGYPCYGNPTDSLVAKGRTGANLTDELTLLGLFSFGGVNIRPSASGVSIATSVGKFANVAPFPTVYSVASGTLQGQGEVGVLDFIDAVLSNGLGLTPTLVNAHSSVLDVVNSTDGTRYRFYATSAARAAPFQDRPTVFSEAGLLIDGVQISTGFESLGCIEPIALDWVDHVSVDGGDYATYGASKCTLDLGVGSTFKFTMVDTADFATADVGDATDLFGPALVLGPDEYPDFTAQTRALPQDATPIPCPPGATCYEISRVSAPAPVWLLLGVLSLRLLRRRHRV